MDIKWYLYYEWQDQGVRGYLEEFQSREELNAALAEMIGLTKVKIISGYTLSDRSIYDS